MENKVAIVTGGATGIGRAHTELLLERKAKVCIGDINTEAGQETEKELQEKYGEDNVMFTQCDVAHEEQLRSLFKVTKEKFGQIDIVVNNAGIAKEGKYMLMIDINLRAVIIGTNLGLEFMGKPNGGNGGVVINMGSIKGLTTSLGAPVYAATKHAVVGYTRSIGALTAKTHGVRVNCICPYYVNTPLLTAVQADDLFSPDMLKQLQDKLPQLNLLSPSTVAECLVPLIEDETLSGEAMLCDPVYPQALLTMPSNDEDIISFYVKDTK